jgi:D-alanyl-D-alanine carboxypeptidase
MNRKAKELKMHKTTFANPHGLANVLNLSTAHDMMLLSQHVVGNLEFKTIMSTK